MNNVKQLFITKIDEIGGEPIFYIAGIRNNVVDVQLVSRSNCDKALKSFSAVVSCHVWGFQVKNGGEGLDTFKITPVDAELGIR